MNSVPKLVWLVLVVYLLVLSLEELGWVGDDDSSGNRLISVNGTGEVMAVPDIAEVSFSTEVQAKTAREAQNLAAEKSKSLQAFCQKVGIDKKDMQTTQYSLEPVYYYVDNKPPQLSGFKVTQSLKVVVRDLDKTGELIAGGVEAGANGVSGPVFSVDDREKLVQEAREKAFDNARENARLQAKAAGVKLGKVVGFSENEGGMPRPPGFYSMAKSMEVAAAPAIEAGSQKIQVNASLTYELK